MHAIENTREKYLGLKRLSICQAQPNLPMWSPLLSNHLYQKITFFLSFHSKIHKKSKPPLRGHLSYKANFSLSQRLHLNTGLTVLGPNRPGTFIGTILNYAFKVFRDFQLSVICQESRPLTI